MKNRKMKLLAVRNTVDGQPQIGCRAIGIHNGFFIERTAWMPVDNLSVTDGLECLETLAIGKYKRECNTIDTMIHNEKLGRKGVPESYDDDVAF